MRAPRRLFLASTAAAGAALIAGPAIAQSPAASGLTATLLALYKRPTDPAKFDAYYAQHHAPLAKQLPNLQSFTISKALPTSSPYYMVATLIFPSMDALTAALASDTGKSVVGDLKNFAQAGVDVVPFENHPV